MRSAMKILTVSLEWGKARVETEVSDHGISTIAHLAGSQCWGRWGGGEGVWADALQLASTVHSELEGLQFTGRSLSQAKQCRCQEEGSHWMASSHCLQRLPLTTCQAEGGIWTRSVWESNRYTSICEPGQWVPSNWHALDRSQRVSRQTLVTGVAISRCSIGIEAGVSTRWVPHSEEGVLQQQP